MLQAEQVGCMSNRSHGDSAPCPAESPLSLHWITKTLLETHLVQQGWNNAHGNQQQSCTEKRTLGVMKGSKENQSTAGVTGTSPISSTGLCSSCCSCASLSHCKLIYSPSWCQGQRSSGSGNYPKFGNSLFPPHYCL